MSLPLVAWRPRPSLACRWTFPEDFLESLRIANAAVETRGGAWRLPIAADFAADTESAQVSRLRRPLLDDDVVAGAAIEDVEPGTAE